MSKPLCDDGCSLYSRAMAEVAEQVSKPVALDLLQACFDLIQLH